ncbi:hypothetical protein HD554DRAFT_2060158 [Boletus coccyginus]|nr:hypothetical protein HD554DRAFT_2060158 [Boletus coccyginus]
MPYTISDTQTSHLGQDMEGSFQAAESPYEPSLVGIPLPCLGIGQPGSGFLSENSTISNFADPTAGVNGTPHPWESPQMVDPETTTGSCAPSLVVIPLLDWGIGQLEAGSSFENPSVSNSADPVAEIDGLPLPEESGRLIDPEAIQSPSYTTSPPFVEQSILSVESPVLCQWKDGDEPVCGEPITHRSAPRHLSKHGIEKKSRSHPTKCHWVGCKRKKTMKRGSIRRHVSEIHLGKKRRVPQRGYRNPISEP